ncbi:4-hydroxy-tetrahydrodipicolinate synthase [Poritiphilus flavus]|uniref:4-hydroxy-tetrahydrodipicolinate synthase n=1 Tax=Poritiphilus flavus TaxID=2697053 RepID=A0A6L9EFC3_9FLAO|nr:4-hydroxy-tetrahydrodipicolinate synthase [Poritiphilus flavus]NAS13381.1 4-hydroxy-tetrahydrodipicolinate synthase [Poritiphilus flavus]
MKELYGTGVALVTPFKDDLTVDEEALRRIVRHCIEGGLDYLVALGTTGEAVTLGKTEKQLVMKTVADENAGRLPLVVGIGGNNTAQLAEELRSTNLDQYDAVLSVSPYYNKPTQEGIYQHFATLAKASPKPIILYNVPGRTGSNMLPATVVRLAEDFENVVAIKEASGDMDQIRAIIEGKPSGFEVISGDDFTALPTVQAGGTGVISVLGQGLPADFSRMINLALGGSYKEAKELHLALEEGMHLIFEEGNPAGIKAVFETLGLSNARVRLPLVEATDKLKAKIASFVQSRTGIPA